MWLLILPILLLASPATAAPLTELGVRGFVAERERAWNAADFGRYFAGFTPGARFTDQAYVGDKPPVPYGTASLAQARDQARRSGARSREIGRIQRIALAPGGQSARVDLMVVTTLTAAGKPRTLCASRVQTLIAADDRILSTGQTDTFSRCRR